MGVTEAEVHNRAIDWFEEKGLRVLSPSEIHYELAYDTFQYRPDFFVMPKNARRKVIAIEAKGSNLEPLRLLGQLLAYSLRYGGVCAAIPESKVHILKKLRTQIRRKITGFDFEILSIGSNHIKRI